MFKIKSSLFFVIVFFFTMKRTVSDEVFCPYILFDWILALHFIIIVNNVHGILKLL